MGIDETSPAPESPDSDAPVSDSSASTGKSEVQPLTAFGILKSVIKHPLFKPGLAIGILLFLYMTGRFDFDQLKKVTRSWPLLIAGAGMMVPGFFIAALRYRILLMGFGLDATYRQVLSWTMIGALFDVTMPSATGGDVVKIVYVMRAFGKGRKGVAGMSVLVDRLAGLLGLFLFGLLVCGLSLEQLLQDDKFHLLPYFLLVVCAGAVAGFLIFTSLRFQESPLRRSLFAKLPLGETLETIYGAVAGFRQKPLLLLAALGLSVLNHASWCFALLILCKGLGLSVPIAQGLAMFPLALFLNIFGFAGGFGTGELAFEYLMSHFLGTAAGEGTSLALVFHVLAFLVRIILGLPFFLMHRHEKVETEGESSPAN